MVTTLGTPTGRRVARRWSGRPRAGWATDLVTTLLGGWVVAGLVADGHAHVNAPRLETFFTPSHGVLYSGYVAVSVWIGWQVLAWRRRGRTGLGAVPVGYGLGLLGAAVFAAGGLADLAWHSLLGIEADVEALLSPPHLLLFLGVVLISTTPWRAAWSWPGPAAPSFRVFLPVLLSVVATAMFVAFFLLHLSPFSDWAPTSARAALFTGHEQRELFQSHGVAEILVTTAALLLPLLLLVRRWRPPFGSATVLFTTVAVLTSAIFDFRQGALVLAGLVGGLTADLLVGWLRPAASRPGAVRALATAVPAALWLPYFGLVAARYGLGWPATLWAGSVVLASLAGLALGLLAAPPDARHGRTSLEGALAPSGDRRLPPRLRRTRRKRHTTYVASSFGSSRSNGRKVLGPSCVARLLALRPGGVILLIPMVVVLVAGLWLILRPIVSGGRTGKGEDRRNGDAR
jgi:hypothetical protein